MNPDQEQSFVPALCNRLDRNTRGLLIAGKHARALRDMNAAIRAHEVHKYYLALCEGRLSARCRHDHAASSQSGDQGAGR